MNKLIWVDPPYGCKFGFPKLYDKNKNPDMNKWLVDNGYPQSIIDQFPDGLSCGMAEPSQNECNEYYQQLYYKY